MGGMDIALVTETFPPEINGVAMTLGRLADGLRRRGHRLHLVRPRQLSDGAPTQTDELSETGNETGNETFSETLATGLPIPGYAGLRFGLPATHALLRAWRAARPDIVHIATEGPLGWSALRAARKLGLPVSSSFHTNFHAYSSHYGIGWLRSPINGYLRSFHNRTDATLVPTRDLARSLGAEGFKQLRVVSRGVDTQLFNPGHRSTALRARWGADNTTLVVSYVGRLAAEKNLDLVTLAFDAIRRVRPDARMVFVGDGPKKSALAARHPEHIFAGMRRGDDLAAHYASTDIFLFPSLTETFGNVTLEALASGLGVIAYDHAAAGELIESGRNGLLAPAGDAAAFIEAATTLACNPQHLARMRVRAATRAAAHDWEYIHDAFAGVLEEIARVQPWRDHAQGLLAIAPD